MQTLETLIPQYVLNKQELDSYKKLCDEENAEIKKIMRTEKVQAKTVDNYTVSYVVAKKESINEAKALSILNRFGLGGGVLGIVKTREYIDYDALEKAIYSGALTNDVLSELDTTREIREVETLRISKKKGKTE